MASIGSICSRSHQLVHFHQGGVKGMMLLQRRCDQIGNWGQQYWVWNQGGGEGWRGWCCCNGDVIRLGTGGSSIGSEINIDIISGYHGWVCHVCVIMMTYLTDPLIILGMAFLFVVMVPEAIWLLETEFQPNIFSSNLTCGLNLYWSVSWPDTTFPAQAKGWIIWHLPDRKSMGNVSVPRRHEMFKSM